MSEARLQFDIVMWFRNNFPDYRGLLMEMNNSTNKGATRAGMGLVKGASDLVMCTPSGEFMGFELKAEDSRHKVSHLESQLDWARKINDVGGCVFFVSSLEEFKRIIIYLEGYGVTIHLKYKANKSCDKIEALINTAKSKNKKSLKVNL